MKRRHDRDNYPAIEITRDNSPVITGTHRGTTGTTVCDPGSDDFRVFMNTGGVAVVNVTQDTGGNVVNSASAIREHEFDTDVSFNDGDTYAVYLTPVVGSVRSRQHVDRLFGRRVHKGDVLVGGRFKEDVDLGGREGRVFGPGQPIRRR